MNAMDWRATGLDADSIRRCDYSTFIATINQTNVPPGGFQTLNSWRLYSNLTASSQLLEVACSTGFNSRELSRMSGCSALGFDRNLTAVTQATRNIEATQTRRPVRYVVADGLQFTPNAAPTHVVVGAALRFFPNPEAMLARIVSWFSTEGYVLAADFSWEAPPRELIELRESTFGLHVSPQNYASVRRFFKGLDELYWHDFTPVLETSQEIEEYCDATILRFRTSYKNLPSDVSVAAYERLHAVKVATNRLRQHQRCHVCVLRYSAEDYPRRYVEIF